MVGSDNSITVLCCIMESIEQPARVRFTIHQNNIFFGLISTDRDNVSASRHIPLYYTRIPYNTYRGIVFYIVSYMLHAYTETRVYTSRII